MDFCTPFIVENLHYLRALLIIKISETENVENLEKAEQRSTLLKTAEELMRGSLKRIQLAEEVSHIKAELEEQKVKQVERNEARIAELTE
jgi:hypothetical protein